MILNTVNMTMGDPDLTAYVKGQYAGGYISAPAGPITQAASSDPTVMTVTIVNQNSGALGFHALKPGTTTITASDGVKTLSVPGNVALGSEQGLVLSDTP